MRLLLASNELAAPGGSETYLLTLGRNLQRLGHEVWLTAGPANVVDLAEGSGLRAVRSPAEVDPPADRVVVQDAIVAGEIAAVWPEVPQLLVVHSGIHDLQLPGALPNAVAALVALNDRTAVRAVALAERRPVHRLTQPVDVGHFTLGPPPRAVPKRLLLFGNNRATWRSEPLVAECNNRGIEVVRIGAAAGKTVRDPVQQLRDADIVVGYGRCALEAMACGRTALVFDRFGSDGWVTPESYRALEASGFTGTADLDDPGRAEWASVLDTYDPRTGAVGHDLALRHHDARDHAVQLLELLDGLPGSVAPQDPDCVRSLSRVWREQWRWERQSLAWAQEVDALRTHDRERDAEVHRLRQEVGVAEEQLRDNAAKLAAAEATVEIQARDLADVRRELEAVLASPRYRAADRAARVVHRLRRRTS